MFGKHSKQKGYDQKKRKVREDFWDELKEWEWRRQSIKPTSLFKYFVFILVLSIILFWEFLLYFAFTLNATSHFKFLS